VAAKHALVTGRAHRVFILDWDIHHGNGIQDLTYQDPSIFYCSIHRGGSAKDTQYFYPGTGRPTEVGCAGTNLNIAWGQGGMGDEEYRQAFTTLILPVLQHFKPDLILVACGLDAVKGDFLGDCGLSRDMYYHMTRMLMDAMPGTPLVMALEGGYNMTESAACMERIAMALLDDPLPPPPPPEEDDVKQGKQGKKMKKALKRRRSTAAVEDEHQAILAAALRSIQRSSKALQQGGVCVSGCHYKCRHATQPHALPLKKRQYPAEEMTTTA